MNKKFTVKKVFCRVDSNHDFIKYDIYCNDIEVYATAYDEETANTICEALNKKHS
jgi:hypothetical protein